MVHAKRRVVFEVGPQPLWAHAHVQASDVEHLVHAQSDAVIRLGQRRERGARRRRALAEVQVGAVGIVAERVEICGVRRVEQWGSQCTEAVSSRPPSRLLLLRELGTGELGRCAHEYVHRKFCCPLAQSAGTSDHSPWMCGRLWIHPRAFFIPSAGSVVRSVLFPRRQPRWK